MKTKRGLILLLTDKQDPWVLPHLQESHEFIATDDLQGAVKTLHNIRYDLIMADDAFLQDQTLDVVEEIKRRFPTLPLMVLSDETDADYQTQLIRAGVDDLLSMRLSKDELVSHVRLMLKQHAQNRALVERNQKLYMIASLTRLLETSDEPRLVILNAIHFISNLFRLEGIAVVLREGDKFRLYAGNTDFINKNQLFDSVLHPGDHDPFLWTMRSRLLQVHANLSRNPYYVPIPIFSGETSSAAILPLVTGREVIGALGIFAPEIENEDLFIYEQFAVQFAAGLRTAFQHQAQRLSLETNERLLDAWHAFANASAPTEVAAALAQVVADIPLVTRVVVWLFDDIYVDNYGGQVVAELPPLNREGVLYGLGYRSGEDNPPRDIVRGVNPILHPILSALNSPQVTAFPIQNAGLLFVSLVEGYAVDTALVNHMVQIAVYALQRIHLNHEILKNHARVMSVLVSINEGIFFVDEHNRVVICNPQVTELTRVPTGQFVNQESDVLLRAIADETGTPAQTFAHLQAARTRIRENEESDYPIVAVTLADGIELLIDFVKFLGDGNGVSWVGVVRPKNQVRESGLRLDPLFERIPYAQARSMISALSEQHGSMSYGERQRLLEDLEAGIERIGRQWDNVIDLYRLQNGGLEIRREDVQLNGLLERVISARVFNRAFRQISIAIPTNLITVTSDEYALGRALTALIQRALEASPTGVPIHVAVESGREVQITIEDMGSPMPIGQLESPEGENANLSVYIAGELVRRSGGHLYVGGTNHIGTSLRIVLPASPALMELIPATAPVLPAVAEAAPASAGAARAPQRELERIMLIKGRSTLAETLLDKLEEADYEVIDYTAVDEALPAVTEAHWDLLIVDAKLADRSGIDVCKRIRQRSEVPIILISDEGTGQDKADGLNAGADDYISSPIGHDELLARVRVIFARRHLPDRTSEPLLMDNLYIDFAKRTVFLDNKPLELTRIEYDLLYTLVMNKGQTVTHKQLLSQVWGPEHQGETQYLWVNISRLRKKLEPATESPRHIRTQPGVGYFFDAG